MAIRKFLNKYWGWTFLLIPLALQAIFFYFPMVQGAFYSLTNWTGLTYNYKFVGLNNYKLLMIDGKFFTAIAFTLILTLALIIGEITIGMAVTRALNSKMKGQTFFRAWFFFPAVLSGLTVSLIFKQFFNYGLPTIGKILGISFLQESLLGTPIGAVVATIFVLLWQGVAMPIILFLAGLQSIPSDILEAASIDGATSKQTFWKIELPYLLPTISMVFILALKSGLTAFDQIFALTSGGPNNATTSLGLLVYNYAFKSNQYGYANAIALILFLIIGIVSLIQIKLSKKFEI